MKTEDYLLKKGYVINDPEINFVDLECLIQEYADQETSALRAENERLRGLIEKAHEYGFVGDGFDLDKVVVSIEESWESFKTLNNL